MAATLMRGLQCLLKVSSCNTPFTKVKLKLKTTQLKIICNSYPERKFSGVIVLREFHRGKLSGGGGGSYPGGTVIEPL